MGLLTALHMNGRSLQAFTAGIHVAGQNIANANTPGYIREELVLSPDDPYRSGRLILGTGVYVEGIRQQVNAFLETRVQAAKGDFAAVNAKASIYLELEDALNELGDRDLSTGLSKFIAAVHDLTNEPDDVALRERLVGEGTNLARDIKDLRVRVDELRQSQTLKVNDLVREANELIDEIDRLNPQIVKLEAGGLLGSDAGALRSQRYAALHRLAEIVPVQYRQREDGGVDVFMGSDWLLLDGSKQHLETYSESDREVSVNFVRTTQTKSILPDGPGELRGTIDGRDQVLGGFVDSINELAANLISEFNQLHASGEGTIGYSSLVAEQGVGDPAVSLSEAGLNFAVQHGGFDVKVLDRATGQITTTRVAIDLDGLNANDTTLTDLAASLDALSNVGASIDSAGRLNLTAAEGYELKFANDTSGVLTALGINTFFTGTDADSIGVNQAIKTDHRLLATGQGGGPGDNRNVAALAGVLDGAVAGLQGQSLTEFYEATVSQVGQGSASEAGLAEGADAYLQSLMAQRQQYSGVSLDEEAIKIMEFQRAYQSAARLISTIDELLGVLMAM